MKGDDEMNKEFVALEGKVFTVELQSQKGSTNYGWCVASLPKEIILMDTENVFVGGRAGGTMLQRFYFGAVSSEEINVTIDFVMTCWSDLTKVSEHFTAEVTIIPKNSSDFVSYSENETNTTVAYGFIYKNEFEIQDSEQGVNDINLKYGYPCGVQDANLKYGYPCSVQDANLKYGYPCGVQDANLKYGYPCSVQDANLKYGYPCMETTKDARPYGLPYWE